ncbi:MAG: hypothetical protein ACJA1A_001780 [Saprospiraceae bacterium]|jgi:hypothetical protein|tara:strand:- start:678 stop:2291 length:1614 start_codon:yes stop_codon:yes gene_type:complete
MYAATFAKDIMQLSIKNENLKNKNNKAFRKIERLYYFTAIRNINHQSMLENSFSTNSENMKKIIFFILFTLFAIENPINAQQVVSSTYLQSYDIDHFVNELNVPFSKTGVDMYRILYTTKDIEGAQDTASGLLVIPQQVDVSFPLVSYSHGTAGGRFDVPGYLSFEHNLPAIYASMGVVCIAADYLGLGNSRGIHPYVHADSEAWVSYDMMMAIKAYLSSELDVKLNDQLYLTGYSQGGHAAMAFHRLLETETEIEVSAAFPMSGPYSISTGMRDLLLSDQEYDLPSYLAATAVSYQAVYGNLYPNNDIKQFFRVPYADIILKLATEESDLSTINQELVSSLIANEGGVFPKKMIFDNIVEDVLADENHAINVALRDNDVYDWTPLADTRLLYCSGDEQVAFQNSLIAEAKMLDNGAQFVSAIELGPTSNHTECVTPAATNFVFYLLLNATTTSQSKLEIQNTLVYPNPTFGPLVIKLNDPNNGKADIYNLQGQIVSSFQLTKGINQLFLNLEKGMYFINILNEAGKPISIERLVIR